MLYSDTYRYFFKHMSPLAPTPIWGSTVTPLSNNMNECVMEGAMDARKYFWGKCAPRFHHAEYLEHALCAAQARVIRCLVGLDLVVCLCNQRRKCREFDR